MTIKKLMNKNIKISKLDAAKRQLETAIRLFFNDADPISIHTLASAAHCILSDLNKKVGGHPMIVSDFLILEKYKQEFRKKISEAKNHFKHADKDPDAVIDFYPEINDFLLYDACSKYEELTGESVSYFRIFAGWFVSGNLKAFSFDKKFQQYGQIREKYKNKADYFSAMLSVSGYLSPYSNDIG